jgi:hypothetical protein
MGGPGDWRGASPATAQRLLRQSPLCPAGGSRAEPRACGPGRRRRCSSQRSGAAGAGAPSRPALDGLQGAALPTSAAQPPMGVCRERGRQLGGPSARHCMPAAWGGSGFPVQPMAPTRGSGPCPQTGGGGRSSGVVRWPRCGRLCMCSRTCGRRSVLQVALPAAWVGIALHCQSHRRLRRYMDVAPYCPLHCGTLRWTCRRACPRRPCRQASPPAWTSPP